MMGRAAGTSLPAARDRVFRKDKSEDRHRSPSELDVSGSEWQSFRRAIKIRDRITHPKSVSDLNISDEDYNDVSAGFGWVLISHVKLATAIVLKAKSEAG